MKATGHLQLQKSTAMHHAPIRTPFPDPPEAGEAIEVATGVLWMRLPLPMKLDHVNVFALDDGDSWTIVDTGFNSRKTRGIWQSLLDGPLSGKPVGRILVTHHHPDHVGLAGWFQSEHGADLVTTRTAWLFSRMLTLDAQDRPVPETLQFYRRCGMDPEIYATRAEERPFNFADVVWPMPLGFTRIKQDDTIRIGGREWTVHIGNGHAPEHACLFSNDGALVLGGDQLIASISSNLGVYATEPEADPVSDWLEACTRLQAHATDTQLVLPGHKLLFTGLPARLGQLIENHHSALERLAEFLKTPRSAHDCFSVLFKRKIGPSEYGLALVESMAHLNHLHQAGLASRTLSDNGAYLFQS